MNFVQSINNKIFFGHETFSIIWTCKFLGVYFSPFAVQFQGVYKNIKHLLFQLNWFTTLRSLSYWGTDSKIIDQMDEDDLEDFWRDYLTKPKQVYLGLNCDGWNVDDDDKISPETVYIIICCYIKYNSVDESGRQSKFRGPINLMHYFQRGNWQNIMNVLLFVLRL
jgi:hypothetical protein